MSDFLAIGLIGAALLTIVVVVLGSVVTNWSISISQTVNNTLKGQTQNIVTQTSPTTVFASSPTSQHPATYANDGNLFTYMEITP